VEVLREVGAEHLPVGRAEHRRERVVGALRSAGEHRLAPGPISSRSGCSPRPRRRTRPRCPRPCRRGTQPVHLPRPDARDRRHRDAAVRRQGAAGQRVRSSAAGADDANRSAPSASASAEDVRHAVGDRAAGQPGRAGVPGPGVRREPHPDLVGCRDELRRQLVALRRAVEADDEGPSPVTTWSRSAVCVSACRDPRTTRGRRLRSSVPRMTTLSHSRSGPGLRWCWSTGSCPALVLGPVLQG
jgi:hypothetical protein